MKPSLSALQKKLEEARKGGPAERQRGAGAADAVRQVAQATGSASPPTDAPKSTAAKAAGGPVSNRRIKQDPHIQARRLMVRTFVRYFLKPGETFMNGAAALRKIKPDVANPANAAYMLVQDEDVKTEMQRQLRAIDKAADMDDQWVYDRWRAIANANIFDYCTVGPTGKLDFSGLDPAKLTLEQQVVIREIRTDPKTQKVVGIKLANIDRAVENVARARQMIEGNRDAATVDLAQRLTDRMSKAAKRIGLTIDNETGEITSE